VANSGKGLVSALSALSALSARIHAVSALLFCLIS
jgi:hypothetical protein